jgi:hypothetical protein
MLFIMRKIGLRTDDLPPQVYEIVIPLIIWSWVFEAFLPHVGFFKKLATSDHVDIFWYTLGGVLASIFWKKWYGEWQATDSQLECGKKALLTSHH